MCFRRKKNPSETYLHACDIDGREGDALDTAADIAHHVHRLLRADGEVRVAILN